MNVEERDAAYWLGEDGPFAQAMDAFVPREGQIKMASAVEATLSSRGRLIVEAETGTGKTLAYLVPILASGVRAIISTGTKTLQDQLFEKDIPLACQMMGLAPEVRLLKGRTNYLCRYRLSQTVAEGLLTSREDVATLQSIVEWSQYTISGDLAHAAPIREDSALWPQITSTRENCLGTSCPNYDDCFVVRARREAEKADILVVNHHLLIADLMLKDQGFSELLPPVDAIVFDEAHQLPTVARRFLGWRFSTKQFSLLLDDVRRELMTAAPDMLQAWGNIEILVADVIENLRNFPVDGRVSWENRPREAWERLCQLLFDVASKMAQLTEACEARSEGLARCHQRSLSLLADLQRLMMEPARDWARWLEKHSRSIVVTDAPLNVAEPLQQRLKAQLEAAWVFTSATLSVGGDLRPFAHEIGLEGQATTLTVPSPFDFQRQALLYVPRYVPEPNTDEALSVIFEHVRVLVERSRGRAFLLLTSHRALSEARLYLADLEGVSVFFQGDAPKMQLLEQFRTNAPSLLVATGAFWEGVDVPGEDLQLVMIDRLPFPSPDDPMTAARTRWCRRRGLDAFEAVSLYDAVLTLKQGAGRLVRRVTDRGVLVIFDPRLVSRPYGESFVRSLPPFKRTRRMSEVEAFFEALHQHETDRN